MEHQQSQAIPGQWTWLPLWTCLALALALLLYGMRGKKPVVHAGDGPGSVSASQP